MSGYLTFEGMCWPDPTDPRGIEWKLRHAPQQVGREDQLVLAAVVAAYRHLVNTDSRTRQQRVMQIRSAACTDNQPQEGQ